MTDDRSDWPDADDPFAFGTPIRPGHPLYATAMAWEIFGKALTEAGLDAERADMVGRSLVARLTQHDPPIYLCTAEEMRDEE